MCLADFTSSYISKKADDLPIKPDEIRSSTVPVSNINDVKLNLSTIVLKNELGETWKRRNVVDLVLFTQKSIT